MRRATRGGGWLCGNAVDPDVTSFGGGSAWFCLLREWRGPPRPQLPHTYWHRWKRATGWSFKWSSETSEEVEWPSGHAGRPWSPCHCPAMWRGRLVSQSSFERQRSCMNILARRMIGESYSAGSNNRAISVSTRRLVICASSSSRGGGELHAVSDWIPQDPKLVYWPFWSEL